MIKFDTLSTPSHEGPVAGPTLHGAHFLSASSHQQMEHLEADRRAAALAIAADDGRAEERLARRQATLRAQREHAHAEAERKVEAEAAAESVRLLQAQVEAEKPCMRDRVIGFGAVAGGLGTVVHSMVPEAYRPIAYVGVVGIAAFAGREWSEIESRNRRTPILASLAAAQREARLKKIPCMAPAGSFNRVESGATGPTPYLEVLTGLVPERVGQISSRAPLGIASAGGCLTILIGMPLRNAGPSPLLTKRVGTPAPVIPTLALRVDR